MKKEYITTSDLLTLEYTCRVRIYSELKYMFDDYDSTSILVYQKQSAYIHAAYAVLDKDNAWVYIPTRCGALLIWHAVRDELHKIKNKIKGERQRWRLI